MIAHFGQSSGSTTIGYATEPAEHDKGYGTEALQLIADYLFLAKEIHRIQANTDPETKQASVCSRKWVSRRKACLGRAVS